MKKIKSILYILIGVSIINCQNASTEIVLDSTSKCSLEAIFLDSIYDIELNLFLLESFEEALNCSKNTGKPILSIYSGYGVVGDRKVIWEILGEKEINSLVKDSFILSCFLVDDRKKLADTTETVFDYEGRKIRNYGNLYLNREKERYGVLFQPLYTITNSKDIDLAKPLPYTPISKKEIFISFLKEGLKNKKDSS